MVKKLIGAPEAPASAEEILTTDGGCGKAGHFSLGVWSLVVFS